MKKRLPSITAERNAFLRAVEDRKPSNLRLFQDPFAKFFLGRALTETLDDPSQTREILDHWEATVPGVCGSVLVRTRFMDHFLWAGCSSGIRQMVILGAGYDTRAYRFPGITRGVRVFELDDPATQEMKRIRLKRIQGISSDGVVHAGIDLDGGNLEQVLFDRGYDPKLKTHFIWEGVTYYLTAESVEIIIGFIANHSAMGSGVAFDFFPPSVANGSCDLPEAGVLRIALAAFDERLSFGIDPESVEPFMKDRGFHKIRVADHHGCQRLYLGHPNMNINLSSMFFFVHAETAAGVRSG